MTLIVLNHNFGPNVVFAGMRDGAAVNGATIKQLLFFYPNITDVICFSHATNNVRCHFEFRVLDTFLRYWVNLFSHSYNAKLLWKERTVKSICSHSNTRWWSKWELLKQVSDYFGHVAPFLQGNENLSPLIRQHLLEIINDPQDLQDLHLELGVLGRCFILSWRRWATDIHLLWAFISCLACCYSRPLSMYLSHCYRDRRWWCCSSKSTDYSGKGLCSTWIELLSTEVQCPVPQKRPCFQGSTSLLPSPSFCTETRCSFPRRVKKTFHLWVMPP